MSSSDGARFGRTAQTFVPTPEWIVVSRVSAQAQALYTTLLAHVNRIRADGVVWPGMDTLAELLGYSRRQSVRPYLAELVALGAVEVEVEKTPQGRRNVYVVNEVPSDDYTGPRSLREFYGAWHAVKDAKRAARQRGSGATAPHPSGGLASHPSGATAHKNQTNPTQTKQHTRSTPSGDDDVTSSRRKHVSDQMRFFKPKGYDRMDDVRIAGALPGVFVKIMERHGLDPHTRGVNAIGDWVHQRFDKWATRDEVCRDFQVIVKRAVAGEENEWLVLS